MQRWHSATTGRAGHCGWWYRAEPCHDRIRHARCRGMCSTRAVGERFAARATARACSRSARPREVGRQSLRPHPRGAAATSEVARRRAPVAFAGRGGFDLAWTAAGERPIASSWAKRGPWRRSRATTSTEATTPSSAASRAMTVRCWLSGSRSTGLEGIAEQSASSRRAHPGERA